MTTSKIQKEIEQLQKVIDDPKTSADIKKSLSTALENAKKHLTDAAAAPAKSAKKVLHTHGSEKSLKDCRDIIAKYKREKSTEAKRVQKRVASGKPAELTVPETIKKTAKAVKKKVEEKPLAKTDANAAVAQIKGIVQSVVDGMKSVDDVYDFTRELIDAIKDIRWNHKPVTKAAKGMHVADVGDKQYQINVYGYKTENFGYAQKEYFEQLMQSPGVEAHAKADIVAMARDIDDMMAILADAKKEGTIGELGFMFAARHALRAMYYVYPVLAEADADLYPAFLALNLSEIAVWVNAGERADVGLQVAAGAANRKFDRGGVIGVGDKVTVDTDALKTLHPYMNNGGAKLLYNKLVEHSNKVAVVDSEADDNAFMTVKWSEDQKERVPVFLLVKLPDQSMALGGALDFGGQPSPAPPHFRFVDEGYDQTMLEEGGEIDEKKPVGYLSNLFSKEAAEHFIEVVNEGNPTAFTYFVERGPNDDDKNWAIYKKPKYKKVKKIKPMPKKGTPEWHYIQTLKDAVKHPRKYDHVINVPLTFEAKQILAEYGIVDKKMFGGQINVAAPNNLEMKDNGGDQFLAPSTMKKGGKVTFKDKENAIAKRLQGTKVPSKYKSKYGKRYGKVTSHEAAKNIAGALVRDERARKAVKKSRSHKKMFGGLVNVAAPNNLQMKDNGGEQFLAPSV